MTPIYKLNKSTRICLIYFSTAQFNDNIKFRWRNLNINDIMLINLYVSLITNLYVSIFWRHSDKTATFRELLLDINNFSKTIVDVNRKSHEFSFKIVRVIAIVVSNPVNFLVNARLWRQSNISVYSMTSPFAAILLLSPPSYIPYILVLSTLYGVEELTVHRRTQRDNYYTNKFYR